MTDRAINFQAIVEGVRSAADGAATVTVDDDGPIDVCRRLFEGLEERTEPTSCEFYMSPNVRRELERRLLGDGVTVESPPFLDRQIRTDVSMPDDTVLFMHPDAVTLGGTVTGTHPVGIGTLSMPDDDRPQI
ncbi:hypothetical protein ACFO5R_10030 [Halosolutus amylolyticus]|uniref:Uncharacterized protein n=1 Tax=Halosolutus amylolyticus TaxID=2932267 RepID=A0ABD5PQR6_9EURY|nr:hypothetical protein [Halosolutus amylolyticus]